MPERPDTMPRLPGSRLCEICGINRQTRDKWARDGLLRKGDDYDQLDLVEVVVLKLLLETLRKKDARIAWSHVRPQLRSVMPGEGLTVIWDAQLRQAQLALTAGEIVKLVRHGRPIQAVEIGTVVEQARDAFRREIEALQLQAATRQLASTGRAKRRSS